CSSSLSSPRRAGTGQNRRHFPPRRGGSARSLLLHMIGGCAFMSAMEAKCVLPARRASLLPHPERRDECLLRDRHASIFPHLLLSLLLLLQQLALARD